MYGLVNKAVEQMVCRDHGEAVWERIKADAGVDVEAFVSNAPYPDEVTYALVGSASRILGMPAADILRAFGEFWILHTALESYGPMMRSSGRTAKEFLLRLPQFHTHVQLIYPDLKPPEFRCSDVLEDSMLLHYSTGRPAGLEPFVEGLVQGIGLMFGTPLQVRLVQDRGQGAAHSTFHISWAAAA